MPEKDKHVISQALNRWANWIETGDNTLSMNEAIRCGTPEKINVLTAEQIKFIVRLRDIATKD